MVIDITIYDYVIFILALTGTAQISGVYVPFSHIAQHFCALLCQTQQFILWGSLSDILFSFVLEKYIVCGVCGLRSPPFESRSVLYISPTDTSSMQNLILQGLHQKLQKSCSRCNKNTWHVESSYILQPPKYLFLFVNWFRYINNNVTKDRCSIPMDTTVRLGPLKLSLWATIDHHGPSIHSGHYTASINCCQRHSFLALSLLLNIFVKYSCTNIFQRRSLCTFYYYRKTEKIYVPFGILMC